MTDLSMETSEDFQVQNYGIGGHFNLHCDQVAEGRPCALCENGNRIATVIFYVSSIIRNPKLLFLREQSSFSISSCQR